MARGKKKESALTPEEKLAQALVPDWEWPYKVPENWCWVRLDKLYKVNPKNEAEDSTPAAFIPMEKIEPGMVSSFTYEVQPWGKAKKGHTQFADGDVAFAKISPCFENRKSMILADLPNGIGGGTTELIVLRQVAMHQKYTFWFVSDEQFIRGGMATYSGTVGQQRISMDYVKNYPVPVPPIAEQQRIVDRIEYLFTKLDEAKEKARSVLDSFETRKAAILHKAFTGELTSKWRAEHNMGMDSWETELFDNCVVRMQNGLAKRSGSKGVPFAVLRLANLSDNGFITDDLREIILDEKEQENYRLMPNDVLMIRVNGSKDNVGKQLLMGNQTDWAFCDHIIRIRYSDGILPAYMVLFSKSDAYRLYVKDNMVSSAGQNTISRKGMARLSVPVPSVSEQTEIVRILDSLFAKEQQAKEAAEAVLEKIDLLKKSILARAFRGELGTNDPTEESAIELLKQVLQEDTPAAPQKRSKSIPKELQAKLATELERKIVKLYFKQETDSLPAEELLSVSSKKFEVMEALRDLEKRKLIKKLPNGNYRLLE